MEHSTHTGPSWNEIFREIGIQMNRRSGLLTKRVLWISAPALVFFFIIRLISNVPSMSSWLRDLDVSAQVEIVYLITAVTIVLAISTIITTALSKVEQTIWLDSYFDGKNLTPQESWKIAKKLYFPWGYLQRKLFYRYYVWIILSIFVVFVLGIYVLVISDFGRMLPENITMIAWSSYIIISGITLVVWTRYLKIKLSYAPFLFLDRYAGKAQSGFWQDFFIELDKLNKVSSGESFKKNVMLELGADTAISLVEYITLKMAGVGVPSIALLAGREAGYRIVYFAKMTGKYVLYRYAFKTVYGNTHQVNEYIYNLK
ncbi:MAG: hypothetical protein RLZZ67_564 [Candidatus Parcubacteria bacterium]|jgi:phage-related protein